MASHPKVAAFVARAGGVLKGKVAIITGSTRGIGRECALALAKEGCNIVVAAKSTEERPNLPGTIYSVAEECKKLGVDALPAKVDMRDAASIERCVEAAVDRFGRIDIVINNASALWWQPIVDTPISKYDLITGINCRGSFILTKLALPHMKKNKFGRVITMSPPIQTHYTAYKGFAAYNISKFGMTMVAMGAASEGESCNITGNALWPATVVESQASKNFKMGAPKNWRKASILSDAVLAICCSETTTGGQLIDDEYLAAECGLDKADLKHYSVVEGATPIRALAAKGIAQNGDFRRGDVRALDKDLKKSTSKL